MKTRIQYIFVIIILCSYGCEKENENDFRNKFTGDYEFFIHHVKGDMDRGNFLDTSYIRNGFVEKYGEPSESLLEINYGTATIMTAHEDGVEKVLKENSALKLSLDNTLSYPGGIGGYGNTWVGGEFINSDSLELHVSAGGRGFWDTRNIVASKINSR